MRVFRQRSILALRLQASHVPHRSYAVDNACGEVQGTLDPGRLPLARAMAMSAPAYIGSECCVPVLRKTQKDKACAILRLWREQVARGLYCTSDDQSIKQRSCTTLISARARRSATCSFRIPNWNQTAFGFLASICSR